VIAASRSLKWTAPLYTHPAYNGRHFQALDVGSNFDLPWYEHFGAKLQMQNGMLGAKPYNSGLGVLLDAAFTR